ncbi:MAG: nicotinate (nicotinamide) nucleotide adenylyltransferase [Gammaproteobacteria bacterium]|nr:nicotinate (nicotinamide) nucleotide adenylyltransferase [Gammaproteobacteria bacterium]
MSRIGVLGGMFDPIHNGHIQAASYASQCLSLDMVKLVPCSIPNHRAETQTDAHHRLAMLELAIEGRAGLEVDTIELERTGVSYSVDTIRELVRKNKEADIVFILGMDAFNSLTSWYDWESLLDQCCFFVLSRMRGTINPDVAAAINLEDRVVDSAESLFKEGAGSFYFATDFNYDLSSTEVRSKLLENKNLGDDLNDKVYSYIKSNNLYH